jgi:uncharacterized protein (DUF2147 family)
MLIIVPAIALWSAAAAVSPGTIEGRWRTDDGKGIVTIAPCGTRMCGRTSAVLDTGPNVPKTDVNNPDPRLRTRPILGMPVLTGFTRSGAMWRGGRAYDPKTGKSYRSTLALNPDGSLKVTGCVLVICQSRRWTRAR